ncbi:hypothetical protein PCE1_000550 [Barthelona sp. PCE]
MPIFSRSPTDRCRLLEECIDELSQSSNPHTNDKGQENVLKHATYIKEWLYGTTDKDIDHDKVHDIAIYFLENDLTLKMLEFLHCISFEGKKCLSMIFNNLISHSMGNREVFVEYCAQHLNIVNILIAGSCGNDFLIYGSMLRESIRLESMLRLVLNCEAVWIIFDSVLTSEFDRSSDSFETLKCLHMNHRKVICEWVFSNYDSDREYTWIKCIRKLLNSDNFVIKLQILELLSKFLLQKKNIQVMKLFSKDIHNLKLIMMNLISKSKRIQLLSFDIFKCFIANPEKPLAVKKVLARNYEKLITTFNEIELPNDDLIERERRMLIDEIEKNAAEMVDITSPKDETEDN